MSKYKKYINLGITSLVVGGILLITFGVLYAFFFVELFASENFSVLLLVFAVLSVILGAILIDGGLFLVIFFSIKHKRYLKRNKVVVDVKSKEK